MSEVKTRVEVLSVEYACDECVVGTMRPTGVQLLSNPPQYPHKCNHCGYDRVFFVTYPSIVYRVAP